MNSQKLQTELKNYLEQNIKGQVSSGVLNTTNYLENNGKKVVEIFKKSNVTNDDIKFVKQFTEDVEDWKLMGREGYSKVNNAELTFNILKDAYNSSYIEATTKISKLRGFKEKTSSALLRFLNPKDYGVVDWRNRGVFELMQLFNNDIEKAIEHGIKTNSYRASQIFKEVDVFKANEMQSFYQNLRGNLVTRSADVDMALFALSLVIWPMKKF